jgi:hypothetical protein
VYATTLAPLWLAVTVAPGIHWSAALTEPVHWAAVSGRVPSNIAKYKAGIANARIAPPVKSTRNARFFYGALRRPRGLQGRNKGALQFM